MVDIYEKQGEYRGFLPLLYLPVSGSQQVRFVSQGNAQPRVCTLSWWFCVNMTPKSLFGVPAAHPQLSVFLRDVFSWFVFISLAFFLCHFTTHSADEIPGLVSLANFASEYWKQLSTTSHFGCPASLVDVLDNAGPGTGSFPCLPLATSFNCEGWSVVSTFTLHHLTSY